MNKQNTAIHATLTNTQAFIVAQPQIMTDIKNFPTESTKLDSIVINVSFGCN